MPDLPILLVLPYLVATAATAALAWVAWRRRTTEAARYFLALAAMACFWSLAALFSHLATDVSARQLWTSIRYVPIAVLPVTWLLFALSFAGLGRRVTVPWVVMLLVIPVLTMLLVATNEQHRLVFTVDWHAQGIAVPTLEYGTWFWIHTVYSYMLVGAGMLVIGRHVAMAGERYYGQAYMMVAGALAPTVANVWFLSAPESTSHMDPTPVAFAVSTAFFAVGLFRYNLFDLIPIARTHVLESMSDGVVVLDVAGRVLDRNPIADQMLGDGRSSILGRTADAIGGVLGTVWEARNGQDPSDVARVTIDAEARWVSWTIRPFAIGRFLPHKLGRGWLLLLRDVTHQKQIERQLVEARDRALEHSRLKSAFLANINHELRTPLTGIIGLAEVLDEELDGEKRDFIRMIRESGERLMHTLDSLLAVSDLNSGRLLPEVEPVDVGPELVRIVADFRPDARRKGLDIWFSDPPDRILASIDPRHFEQAVRQVLDNALKFTDHGAVAVTLSEKVEGVEVQVRDTGRGIHGEFLPHVFDAFRQESAGTARAYEGTGLGLQIARGLLERMGARIRIESEIGVGTTAVLTLPKAIDGARREPPADREPLPGRDRPATDTKRGKPDAADGWDVP